MVNKIFARYKKLQDHLGKLQIDTSAQIGTDLLYVALNDVRVRYVRGTPKEVVVLLVEPLLFSSRP